MNKTVRGLLWIPNRSKPSTDNAQIHTHSLVEPSGESLKEAFKESGKGGPSSFFRPEPINPQVGSIRLKLICRSRRAAMNLKS